MKLKKISNQMLQMTVMTGVFTALFSCQRMQFAPVNEDIQTSLAIPVDPMTPEPPVTPPTPVIPPVTPPTVVIPKPLPVLSNGACAIDSSTTLTSCQKCNVPMNPPLPPQFSLKGQSLIDVMAIGCSIPNKSAPKDYVAPTKAQLISRLNRLSPTFYPDSAMSGFQVSTIEGLKVNPALQQKMFGGLWYQPPFSDAFETYFGLEVKEAVYQLCYQSSESSFTPENSTLLQSKAMLDCMSSDAGPFGCKESPAYVAGNVYRNHLREGMVESIQNPFVSPKPTPSKTCSWEKFDGLYELGGAEQIGKWLVSSQKISMEVKGATGRCSLINKLPAGSDIPTGEVLMSAYICK